MAAKYPQRIWQPPYVSPLMKERACELRKNATDAEELLWNALRRQQRGYKFRRQHPFYSYILDFYCAYAKVAIELDGSSHDGKEVEDTKRQAIIEAQGIKVLRFSNDEVFASVDRVIERIVLEIEARGDRQHGPSPGLRPTPPAGWGDIRR